MTGWRARLRAASAGAFLFALACAISLGALSLRFPALGSPLFLAIGGAWATTAAVRLRMPSSRAREWNSLARWGLAFWSATGTMVAAALLFPASPLAWIGATGCAALASWPAGAVLFPAPPGPARRPGPLADLAAALKETRAAHPSRRSGRRE